jgi:hypothetical protein
VFVIENKVIIRKREFYGKYRGTCVGCYWHNVKKFNQEISKIKDNKGE